MSKKNEEARAVEDRWRSFWEEQGVYRWDPSRGRDETFVVDTPPPTVSGSLHIGHICSYTHTDLMVRFQRMAGKNIYYPMGWDDNGLPTERRVQNVFSVRCDPSLPYDPDLDLDFGRQGDVIGISRPNFIELCDRVVIEDEKAFKDVFQRIGLSVDWNEDYATIDDRSRYVSQLSFIKLIDAGHAELREAPTMWDVDFQSAVAQAEVEDRDKDGAFYRIRFELEGGGDVQIATTRPELLPACIALLAHPDDDRYKAIIGKTVITPLFKAPVPVIADEGAEMEKGTGILMVCTFGDASDVEWWRQLGVPAREVIDRDGRIKSATWGEDHWVSNDPAAAQAVHDKLTGLSINQARKQIAALLDEAGATVGEPENIRRPVKFYEKGDRPLEFIVTRQWFVKVMDKKKELIEQGRKVRWHPDHFAKRYEDWVEGLNQDWCTSRQRYFGVPIPVWYQVRDDGTIDYSALVLPKKEDLPVDPATDAPPGYSEDQRGKPGGFVGDPDVFDTWATSSLTPLIPTGWADDADKFAKLYPTDLRPQAHDIIRTWAFTTITRSFLEDGTIPWFDAAISGFVLDPDRKKMSKSKGNVVVPTDLLDEYGSDAIRYWAGSSRLGVDTAIDHNVFREGKRLVTKLRNAARFVGNFEGEGAAASTALDRSFLARLAAAIDGATARFEAWDHAGALETIETWFWGDFTDNYLELAKARAYAGDPSAIGTLRVAMNVALRLFAPFVPFVTEDLWAPDGGPETSVHRHPWPTGAEFGAIEDDGSFQAAVDVITQIRKAKSESKVSIKFPVESLRVSGSAESLARLESVIDDVTATGNVASYELSENGAGELIAEVRLASES